MTTTDPAGVGSPFVTPRKVPSEAPGVVIGLSGPTGVGKSAAAVELATMLGTRVISCDSMQLYAGFPILTNQPSPTERRAVRHEMVGVLDPRQTFSAAEYAGAVKPLIEDDLTATGWALVVGGTGLYLRAAVAPLAMAPVVDPEIRRRLEVQAAERGAASLHADLARVDPEAAQAIEPSNVRRLIRALEVIETTGAAWSGRDDLWEPSYYHPTLLVALTLDRAELCRRIDARTESIVAGGAEEIRRFLHLQRLQTDDGRAAHAAGATSDGERSRAGIESAIGYREIRRLVEGEQSWEETIAQVAAATRRYARRQSTWLRKVHAAVIIDVRDRSPREIADHIVALALSGEHTKELQRS